MYFKYCFCTIRGKFADAPGSRPTTYRVAEVTMDFEDWAWNEPYAHCFANNDTAALQQLHDTYLSTADEFITYYRAMSKAVYGRDVPLILLMHVGAFDAHMLPELLALYRSRGFTFVSLPQAAADSIYAEDSDIAYKNGATPSQSSSLSNAASPVLTMQLNPLPS